MSGEIIDLTSDSEEFFPAAGQTNQDKENGGLPPPNKIFKVSNFPQKTILKHNVLETKSKMGFSSGFLTSYELSKKSKDLEKNHIKFLDLPNLAISKNTIVNNDIKKANFINEPEPKNIDQQPLQSPPSQTIVPKINSNSADNFIPKNNGQNVFRLEIFHDSRKNASQQNYSVPKHSKLPILESQNTTALSSKISKSGLKVFMTQPNKYVSKNNSQTDIEDFHSSESESLYKEPEIILAKKKLRRKTYYYVKWLTPDGTKDYSWELPEKLSCRDFIEAFEDSIFKHPLVSSWSTIDSEGAEIIRLPKNIADFLKVLSADLGPKISVYNDVDEAGPPEKFKCIGKSIYSEGIKEPLPVSSGCECIKSCEHRNAESCSCRHHQESVSQFTAYSLRGTLKLFSNQGIFECNSQCSCSSSCNNRTVQKGRQAKLQVFRTLNKGWGVRTLQKLPKGAFVTEYVGEIITTDEAERRGESYDQRQSTYLFDLDFEHGVEEDCLYTIDACSFGNVSHFFNHSCDPNMAVFSVFIDSHDPHLFRLGFFTTKIVDAFDELCFDYSPQSSKEFTTLPKDNSPNTKDDANNRILYTCYCGSQNCRGIFLTGKSL